MIKITKSYVAPSPKEFEYWVDLTADPKGNVIKYYAGESKWKPINDDTDNSQSADIKNLQDTKVDKVSGKGLSTNDFTTAYKTKLDNLSNYNDTEIKSLISALTARVVALEAQNA